MPLIQSKQVNKILEACIRVSAFTADGASDVVTTPITTALSTAGNGGVSVPLQVSSSVTTVGVVTASNLNRIEIYNATTKAKISDGSGNEVYGRLTESGGVYTLTYYSLVSGSETAYTSFSSQSIDFEFIYRFDFERLPSSAAVGVKQRNVSDDPNASAGSTVVVEQLTVSGTNTIANLSYTPTAATNVILFVNGVAVNAFGGASAPFSISGVAITWDAGDAGYSVETTDQVIAHYTK